MRLSEIRKGFKPGVSFAMNGLYSKVIRVEPGDPVPEGKEGEGEPTVRIIQVHDTDKERDHRRAVQNWRNHITKRWLVSLEDEVEGEDPKKPQPQGAALFYLSFGDTVEELPSQYSHIGTVGDIEFFSVPGGLEGGFLGGLFGGLF